MGFEAGIGWLTGVGPTGVVEAAAVGAEELPLLDVGVNVGVTPEGCTGIDDGGTGGTALDGADGGTLISIDLEI